MPSASGWAGRSTNDRTDRKTYFRWKQLRSRVLRQLNPITFVVDDSELRIRFVFCQTSVAKCRPPKVRVAILLTS
jgi:hypothetical protein